MKILIVDDHPLMHQILGAVVATVFGESTIEAAGSLAEALEKAGGGEPPDLVLLDLGLPDSAGIETVLRFRKAHPLVRVVVLSAIDEPSCVLRALEAGVAGYVPKTALRLVGAGGIYVPPQAIDDRAADHAPRRDHELTGRQLEVIRLIVRGLANKDIAHRLHIAEDTVKQHARAAYAALGVSSRTQAMAAVTRRGIHFD